MIKDCCIDAQLVQKETLDSILLKDILPPSSPECILSLAEASSDNKNAFTSLKYTYASSTSTWSSQSQSFESKLFQAEMKHDDNDPTHSWELRIGQGGNIYSFQGAFGEAIPPQFHHNAPFVDEVWQMVAVNQIYNHDKDTPPYFIHQAGTYMRDDKYTKGPFYSPNIAKYCEQNQEKGILQCSFASWGQHAHIPTPFHSSILYFNRYQDCGNGVIEVTSAIQNLPSSDIDHNLERLNKQESIGYMNIPWGGVRTSNLQNILLSDRNGKLKLQFPIPRFGASEVTLVKETGGFTTFAQNLKESKYGVRPDSFQMPEAGDDGKALPDEKAKQQRQKRAQRKRVLEQWHLNQTNSADTCEAEASNSKVSQGTYTNNPRSIALEQNGKLLPDELRLIVMYKNPCQKSPFHTQKLGRNIFRIQINPTVLIKSGEPVCNLYFSNLRTRRRFRVNFILHWSWAGNQIYFSPWNQNLTEQDINAIFQSAGDEVTISYCSDIGKDSKDNLALTFVHGRDKKSPDMHAEFHSRIRFGSTDLKRDYTVFVSVLKLLRHEKIYLFLFYYSYIAALLMSMLYHLKTNIVVTPIKPGNTYVNRQYIITGKFNDAEVESAKWVPQTYQNVYSTQRDNARQIQLVSFSDDGTFGASWDKLICLPEGGYVCNGWSHLKAGLQAFFYIECGEKRYVGPDRYFFSKLSKGSAIDKYGNVIIRSYICDGDPAHRPHWKLLGYFEQSSCEDFNGKRFDSSLDIGATCKAS